MEKKMYRSLFSHTRKSLPAVRLSIVCTALMSCMASTGVSAGGLPYRDAPSDADRLTRMNAVEQYYLRDGIHLERAQIAAIVDQKPEIVDLALSERNAVVQNLIGTGGGHFEVNGEASINEAVPVANAERKAGVYVHTPSEEEAVLGYRFSSSSVLLPDTESHKAVWGRTKGGDVYGELGSTYHRDKGVGFPPPPAVDNAYGVYGVANDPDSTRNYGVYGASNVANGIGVYGKNTETGGRAGYFEGSVEQDAAYGGIVKAAAQVFCGPLLNPVRASFGPEGVHIDSSSGEGGICTINFGFDLTGRFFQATAVNSSKAAFVSCEVTGNTALKCLNYEMDAGSLAQGEIMLTIY